MLSVFGVVAVVSLGACSSSSSSPESGSTSSSSSSGSGSTSGDPGKPAAGPFKTYVILGDSISDRGGSGPFFYDLVGDDLKKKDSAIAVVKKSRGGAVSRQLPGQVTSLPATLAGPVAVSVTIGGNDMQGAAIAILQGNDAADRKTFQESLAKAYDELMKPGRFGEGVAVTIFHATIYDPTDGQGNFGEAGCPGYLAAIPKQPTKRFWDNWNNAAKEVTDKYGASLVTVDIRSKFEGHGVGHLKDGSSWFAPDCIHPNTTGHEELHKMFTPVVVR